MDIDSKIRACVDAFVAELTDLIREAAVEKVAEALTGSSTVVRVRGRSAGRLRASRGGGGKRTSDEIEAQCEQIANYDSTVQVGEVGTITSLGDGIARIHGLDKVMAGELLSFPHGIAGLALSLEEDQVGAVIMGEHYFETNARPAAQLLRGGVRVGVIWDGQ